jgi:ligand-binding sensor domain-containing protein
MVSWSPISPDLTDTQVADGAGRSASGPAHAQGPIRSTITVVTVSPVDSDILWVGTDNGNVWVSDDGGQAWTNVNPPGLSYWVTDIAADPFDEKRAVMAVTGYRQGDKLPYLRATKTLGASWSDFTGNLPQVPVNAVVADTDWRYRVFAGTDAGVYVSDNAGLLT